MRTKVPSLLLIPAFALLCAAPGCTPTYPKEKITDSVRKIIKKEYDLDGEARLVGRTLFLDVRLPNLTTTEQKVLTAVLKQVQGASLAITRVSLSSDAKIDFLVLTAKDPSWKLNLTIVQRLEDVKAFLYQKISRSDYEERLVLEIESSEGDTPPAPLPVVTQTDMTMRDFIGRLVASQVNMLGRSNPFLAAMLGNSQLSYQGFSGDEMVIRLSSSIARPVLPVFREIVEREANKVAKKFREWQPHQVKIVGPDRQSIVVKLSP